MKKSTLIRHLLTLLLIFGVPGAVLGQPQYQPRSLAVPQQSPGAAVSQRVGVTDVTIAYSRPAVREREIWGALVPYGEVWRLGANENTTITFSHDVKVEGQPLAAGTYGLHSIPGEDEWQLIFSHDHTGWGSFSYDEARDALRVALRPVEDELAERLTFTIDDVGQDAATVRLRWEKLRLDVRVEVDTQTHVLAGFRERLLGMASFFWQPWAQAANYCMQNQACTEEGIEWAERSVGIEERFENLVIQSHLLEQAGRTEEAVAMRARGVAKGSPQQVMPYAGMLLGLGKTEEARAAFRHVAELGPEDWSLQLGLAQGFSALGENKKALAAARIALAGAPDEKKSEVQAVLAGLE